MISKNCEKQNALLLLLDRERHSKSHPYKANKILRNILASKDRDFHQVWHENSPKPIMYESGQFYFNNYSVCTKLYGINCKPSMSHFHEHHTTSVGKIIDVITHTAPVFKPIKQNAFNHQENLPLSRYIICITKDDWLCQHNWDNGSFMDRIYIKPYKEKFSFLHCDWNTYSEQFVLNSALNPKGKNSSNDVVTILAVFTVYPIDFQAMFEVKRSVFGKSCSHVNVDGQMMILGMGHHVVHLYSFTDVLKQGNLQPYKIGDQYNNEGRIGTHPMGLPFNMNIESAPPLLFNVQCQDQILHFGGHPLHYIYATKANYNMLFTVKSVQHNQEAKNGSIMCSMLLCDNGHAVSFHPDGSGRILHITAHSIHCYKIVNKCGSSELIELFTMGSVVAPVKSKDVSSFGRKLKLTHTFPPLADQSILATDYEDELDLFAILGISPSETRFPGFVALYDNVTGKKVKCINITNSLCDTNHYDLHIDLDSVIIIERDLQRKFSVFLYQL